MAKKFDEDVLLHQKRICKKCHTQKPCIKQHPENLKRAILVDDEGKRWNGFDCPACVTKREYRYNKDEGIEL